MQISSFWLVVPGEESDDRGHVLLHSAAAYPRGYKLLDDPPDAVRGGPGRGT